MNEIDYFKDQNINIKEPQSENTRFGSDVLRGVKELQVGAGNTVFRADQSGIWLGNAYFADAPFKVDMDGNVTASSLGITGGSININNKAIIDSDGNATFIGVSSLNMKAYTNFENSDRFLLTGDVSPTFGNNGMVVAPGSTATHFARALWWITNFVFSNNPTFTCSMLVLSKGSGNGVGFVGLGYPTITGSGITETGKSYCGFEFKKTSGTLTFIAIQCNGTSNVDYSSDIATLSTGDSLELFIKKSSSNIKYYYRLNGGTLTLAATLENYIPTTTETYISFISSNKSSANDMRLQFQCAAYER